MDSKDILVEYSKQEVTKVTKCQWVSADPEDHMPPAAEQYFTPRQKKKTFAKLKSRKKFSGSSLLLGRTNKCSPFLR